MATSKHILLTLFFLGLFHLSYAQLRKSEQQRIRAVENSLLPYVPVQNLPGWNLKERMKFHRVPGVSIAVIRDYKIDWIKAYGLADTIRKIPVTTQTMFSAGSVSKLVSALAIHMLVDKKQLDLDAPINNYLTSWKLPENDFTRAKPITLRLLLSHQAGTSQNSYWALMPDKKEWPSVVDILSGAPIAENRPVMVDSEPGKEFRYSGGGYMIAQMALMDVTKQDFVPFTQEKIFQKVGMPHTTFAQPLPAHFQKLASWAYSDHSWYKGVPYVYPQHAAAGLYSTPEDLAKLLIEVQKCIVGKGSLLSANSAKALVTPQVEVSNGVFREQMGLGAFILQRNDNRDEKGIYFEHTGVNAGFLAYAMGSVTNGNGVVIMLNKDGSGDELGKEIRRAVAKVYGWTNFLPDAIKPISLPEANLLTYAGRYKRGADEVITFKKEKNYLLETINAGNPIHAFPIAPDTIAFSDYPLKGVFKRDNSGKVIGLKMQWQDNILPRLADNEYVPNELMRMGRIPEAIAGYRQLKLNESQITYMAYNFIYHKPAKFKEAQGILELATEQFPQSGMVQARWGELYEAQGKKAEAISAYKKALAANPENKDLKEKLALLLK